MILRRGAVAVLAVLVVSSTSCSSSSKSSSKEGPKGSPINLMSVYEGTGPTAVGREVPDGSIAAAKAINAAGGINGRPVEVIPCDTKNDASVAADCGRRAVAKGVVAMVGDLSIYGAEFMPLLAQHHIPSIGLEPAAAADFSSPASYPIGGGAPVNHAGLAEALAERGARHIAIVRIDIGAAAALAQFADAGLERFHLKVRDVPVPPGAPDMSPYAAAALKGGTDGIVISDASQDAVNFVLAARQAKPGIKIAMIAPSLSDVNRTLGDNAEGIIEIGSTTIALKNAAERKYEIDMKAAGYSNLTGYRLASYASVELFQKVAQGLPNITAPAVFDALQHARGLTIGLTPPLQFTKNIQGFPRVFNPCVFAYQIKDGNLVPLTGKFENAFTGAECATPR